MHRVAYSNITIEHRNEGTTMPLIIPVQLIANVSEEMIDANVRANSLLPVEWLCEREPHDTVAVMCGSGPSIADHLDEIREWKASGAHIFAMNAAAIYLAKHGIAADYQVILDARERTADLIGPAMQHLFSSQVHPVCFERVPDAKLWHLAYDNLDELLPESYPAHVTIGGGAAVGSTACVLANALGYKTQHLYGYDSSLRDGMSHVRRQPINDGEPMCDIVFDSKDYRASLTMKFQAERFQEIARDLKEAGVHIEVHGTGLLPDMFNAPAEVLAEDEKYRRMWQIEAYRVTAPGEACVDTFLDVAKPKGWVMDFGCGTGRAAVKIRQAGLAVITVDFVDNCRDPEALKLTFLKHDMTKPLRVPADYGFCTDMLEHIRPEDVETVIRNIMACVPKCFFQISTVPDRMGTLIGQPLHLTVRPFKWWRDLFGTLGFNVEWSDHDAIACQFYISTIGGHHG